MTSESFNGLAVCSGVAFGKVHIVDRRRLQVPHFHIGADRVAEEVGRFEAAIRESEAQLDELRDRAAESGLPQVKALLEAHGMILRDEALRDKTRDRIGASGQNAEWALQETIREIKQLFDGLDQGYFRERRSDVDIVGDRLMRNLVGVETELLGTISEDAIVIAYDLAPADTVALAKFSARAFVTERGGPTSHTAILARALDVPCVLNARGIMNVAGSGDEVIVDGSSGQVILRPQAQEVARFHALAARREKARASLLADRALPAVTQDGVSVDLLGNIEVTQEVGAVLAAGGSGIGLYRTEFLYVEQPDLRGAEQHYEVYAQLADQVEGPLTIRTVDIGGDKFLRRSTEQLEDRRLSAPRANEENPALGLRAIRLSLLDDEPFREQLEGIMRAGSRGQVQILLPMVTGLEELRRTRGIIAELERSMDARGVPHAKNLPLGVMIETPVAAVLSDVLAREADFLSIGTNDLVQYSLATDRGNESVAYLYRPCHPGVLRLVQMVCEGAAANGIPVRICGEMAADPLHTPLLLGLGLRALSMTARSIPVVKRMIRRLDHRACVELAQAALRMETAEDVEAAVAERLAVWAPELLDGSDEALDAAG